MTHYRHLFAVAALLLAIVGCSHDQGNAKKARVQSPELKETEVDEPKEQPSTRDGKIQRSIDRIEVGVDPFDARDKKVDPPNEAGFSRISIREGDLYYEGILDAKGKEVVQPSSNLLVNDITGNLALVQLERKFLFVPLDDGPYTFEDLNRVNGFQHANPYNCGFALVLVDDKYFYIDTNFEKAFDLDFDFAGPFQQDRALVVDDGSYRIIDTMGKTVAELKYDNVSPQSPWCWQVTNQEREIYRSGFVDLNGNLIGEMMYDDVGYYDPEVKRIRVSREGLHGFLDEHAKVVIPVQFDEAEVFTKGKAKVVLKGRTFFINSEGIEVPEY